MVNIIILFLINISMHNLYGIYKYILEVFMQQKYMRIQGREPSYLT